MLFAVTLRQGYFTKLPINRWHYNSSGVPAAVSLSFALASALGGVPDPVTGEFPDNSVMHALADVQHTSLKYIELQVEAMYDVTDFYTIPYAPSQAGTQGGTAMASYEAYAVQTNRVRTDIRRGNKRFAGVSETYVAADGSLDANMDDLLQTLCDAMSETLEYDDEGNTLSFVPAVLSFEPASPPTVPQTYAPYPTLAEQLDHAALGVVWTPKLFTTTQNTRKRKN